MQAHACLHKEGKQEDAEVLEHEKRLLIKGIFL